MKKLWNKIKSKANELLQISEFEILYDNVLVMGIDITEVDGVLVADSYDDKPEYGIVVRVGLGTRVSAGELVPLTVQAGDLVCFNQYSSTKFTGSDGTDYFIVHEEDIVGYRRDY